MGDHRASVKIEMQFHGVSDKCEMWINYQDDYMGCDDRVINFCRGVYERGMQAYGDEQAEYRIAEEEKAERETLARLKAKYE